MGDSSPQLDQADAPTTQRSGAGPVPRRGGLGRGLGSLIPTLPDTEPGGPNLQVDINSIQANPYQPRANIDPTKLETLAESIRTHGIIQPLIVTRSEERDRYVLIAGERRWRAAGLAGLTVVPILVKDAAPQAILELALVENVVRADLSPLEEAAAYRQLIEEFGLTQARVAERVGRSRVSVTNTLRLLAAPEQIQAALNAGVISEGHARALLGLPTAADQVGALQTVLKRGMTVRQTEELVRRWGEARSTGESMTSETDLTAARLEDRFRAALGTKVSFKRNRGGVGGALTIHYFSDEELDSLFRRLVAEDDW